MITTHTSDSQSNVNNRTLISNQKANKQGQENPNGAKVYYKKHATSYEDNLCMTHDCSEGNQRVQSETRDYLCRQPTCVAKCFSKKKTSNKVLTSQNVNQRQKD